MTVPTPESPSGSFCPHCGAAVRRATWTHCASCGKRLDGDEAAAQEVLTPTPPPRRTPAPTVPTDSPPPVGQGLTRGLLLVAYAVLVAGVVAAVVLLLRNHSNDNPIVAQQPTQPVLNGRVVSDHASGFAMQLPPAWSALSVGKAGFQSLERRLSDDYPGLVEQLRKLPDASVPRLVAVRRTYGSARTTFNVMVKKPATPFPPKDRQAYLNRTEQKYLAEYGARWARAVWTHLNGLSAVRVTFGVRVLAPHPRQSTFVYPGCGCVHRTVTGLGLQYILGHNGKVYTISFYTLDSTQFGEFSAMARTWRFTS